MIIYKTTNLINGKEYVGLDTNNNSEYYGSGKLIKKAINKYGKLNFKKQILCKCSNVKDLKQAEIEYIALYDTLKNGYNLTIGGEGTFGYIFTDEDKKRMSKAHKGKKLSEEQKRKMSKAHLGVKKSIEHRRNISKGQKRKKLSEEHKKKIGISKLGQYHSEEAKRKMSIIKKGRKLSEKTKKKMSESSKGFKHTEETKEKMSKSLTGKPSSKKIILPKNKILKMREQGYTLKQIGEKFNVSYGVIYNRIKEYESIVKELEIK